MVKGSPDLIDGTHLTQPGFLLPAILPLDDLDRSHYLNWKFTLFLSLDWFQLRPFLDGTADETPLSASLELHIAHMRRKIMAYTILRDSVHDWLEDVLEICGASFEQRVECLFNTSYDVKFLWDTVHALVDPDVVC